MCSQTADKHRRAAVMLGIFVDNWHAAKEGAGANVRLLDALHERAAELLDKEKDRRIA